MIRISSELLNYGVNGWEWQEVRVERRVSARDQENLRIMSGAMETSQARAQGVNLLFRWVTPVAVWSRRQGEQGDQAIVMYRQETLKPQRSRGSGGGGLIVCIDIFY